MTRRTSCPSTVLSTLCTAALFASAAAAQVTIQSLVLEGDSVGGVGLVTRIDNLAINDAGQWIVEADTDNPDTEADSVLLLNGALFLREGDALSEPAGATLDSFDTVNLNNLGNSGWNFFLDGTQGGSDDSGVYFNDQLVIQESDLSTSPDLSPGTPYIGFLEAKINDSDQVLLMASVDDPLIASSVDRALVILDLDAGGGLIGETVVVKEGDVLPGQVDPVPDLETGPHEFDFNNAGQALYAITIADVAVYIDDGLIVQEGDPSPVAGRSWSSLTSPEMSLNNNGSYVLSGRLDGDTGTDTLIMSDGQKVVQEGDSLPAIAPFALTGFGTGPLLIGDNDSILWFGDWDDPDTDVDTGLFLDDQLIVQEGVTMIDGQLVDSLSGVQDGYALSDDGTQILFEATLADGTNGAFLATVTTGGGLTLSDPDPGVAAQDNDLTVTGATPGGVVGFIAGLADGNFPIPLCPGESFGVAAPIILGTAQADANGEATFTQFIPDAAGGQTVRFQALDLTACEVSNLVTFLFPPG